MILWQNQCKYVMERMDRAIHKTAWSQLKAKFLQVYMLQMCCVVYRKTCILRMRMPLSLCKLCCNEDRSPAKSANVQRMGYVVQGPVCCNLGSCGLMYHTLAHHMCCKVGPVSLLRALVLQWTIRCKRSWDTNGEANIFYLPKQTFICCKATICERNQNHISILIACL